LLSFIRDLCKPSNEDLPLIENNKIIGIRQLSNDKPNKDLKELVRGKMFENSLLNMNNRNHVNSCEKRIDDIKLNRSENKSFSQSVLKRNSSTPNMFLTINKLKVSNNDHHTSNYFVLKNKFPKEMTKKRSALFDIKKESSMISNDKNIKSKPVQYLERSRNFSLKFIKFDERNNNSSFTFEERKEGTKETQSMSKQRSKNERILQKRIVFSKLNNKIFCKNE
jgi:hypothetical protein